MTTNFVRGSYQEIIDLHTEADCVTAIGIHTPTGNMPRRMFDPFFRAYRQYHYDGCSLSLVPAATLPADISQVSYEAGEPPIDARDILNPILWHGCHGEDMGTILDQLLNGPTTVSGADVQRDLFTASSEITRFKDAQWSPMRNLLEEIYYRGLTDKTWAKAHPQRGFRKGGLHPLVYDLATNMAQPTGVGVVSASGTGQLSPTGLMSGNTGEGTPSAGASGASLGTNNLGAMVGRWPMGDITHSYESDADYSISTSLTRSGLSFFTPRMRGLGWLDTYTRFLTLNPSHSATVENQNDVKQLWTQHLTAQHVYHTPNPLPLLYMGIILLPPAYKAEQHFRLILNHRFSWRGFRGISLDDPESDDRSNINYYYMDPTPDSKGVTDSKEVATESFPVETEVIPDDM